MTAGAAFVHMAEGREHLENRSQGSARASGLNSHASRPGIIFRSDGNELHTRGRSFLLQTLPSFDPTTRGHHTTYLDSLGGLGMSAPTQCAPCLEEVASK